MSDSKTLKRQLTIKTGVVKRLIKEEISYIKEAEDQEARIAKFENEGKEEWEVRKQREVLQDCRQMIPDCRKRLLVAVEDLKGLLESADGDAAESEEAKSAQEVLSLASSSTQAA